MDEEAQLTSLFLVGTAGIMQPMLTEAGRDRVANLAPARVVERVDQAERANPVGQILIVLRWVDYPVRREVAGLGEIQANMALEVKMAIPVRLTVRSM